MKKRIKVGNLEVGFWTKSITTGISLPDKYRKMEDSGVMIVLPEECFTPPQYFQNLLDQMKNDLYPLFRTLSGPAPFTVTRNVLCFVDHIAQLLHGVKGKQTERMQKVISMLGAVDLDIKKNYGKYSRYLIQIYRHDLIHNIRPFPKAIKVQTQTGTENRETWFSLSTICDGGSFEENLAVMSKRNSRKDRKHLRIDGSQIRVETFSLFFDVALLVEELRIKSQKDKKFARKIIKNYYAILRSHYYDIKNFKLDLNKNKIIVSKSKVI